MQHGVVVCVCVWDRGDNFSDQREKMLRDTCMSVANPVIMVMMATFIHHGDDGYIHSQW